MKRRLELLAGAILLALVLTIPVRAQVESCSMNPGGSCVIVPGGGSGDLTIPVVVHVITGTGGTGNVTDQQIADQIAVMDAAYTNLGEIEDIFTYDFDLIGISRFENEDWFNDKMNSEGAGALRDLEAKEALNVDPARVLNIYTTDPEGANLLGYAYLPFGVPGNNDPSEDDPYFGVVLKYSVLPGGGEVSTGGNPQDEGDWAIHEAGHYFGLYHISQGTASGACPGGPCSSNGDCICDTPTVRAKLKTCDPNTNSCDEPAPVENYMANTPDDCRDEFTDGQGERMRNATEAFKGSLGSAPPTVLGTQSTITYNDGTVLTDGNIYLLPGTTLEINGTVTLDNTDLWVGGTLVCDNPPIDHIILKGTSEFRLRETGVNSGCEAMFTVQESGSCIIAEPGSTFHLSGQTHTFNNGGFFAIKEGATLVLEDNAEIISTSSAAAPLIDPGTQFLLGDGARLTFQNDVDIIGTSANPITFSRLNPADAWNRIYIDGAGSTLKYVNIDGATVGVEVSALNVTIDNATLTNNGTGILTDYVGGSPLLNQRSTLTLKNSTISSSTVAGLQLRHTDADIDNTTISGSAGHGILIEDSDVFPFTNNIVTGNGTTTGHGITIISGGDLTMGPATGFSGDNEVVDNVYHEIKVSTGGTLLVGTSNVLGGNEIYKSGNSPSPSARYINNATGLFSPPIMAENTWWNLSSGPPAGAFAGSVDYQPYVSCQPCFGPGGEGAASRSTNHSEEAGLRGSDWHTWLQAEILAARQALNDNPGAEGMMGVVHRLAHLQRLDREDELGEHAATWALLRALRQRLNGNPPEAIREVAIAALVSEARAGLYEQDYGASRDLLAQYASEVMDEESRLVLDLAAVSLFEQEGDYALALAEITTIIAALPPEQSDLALELGLAAAVIEARAEQQAGGGVQAPAPVVASALGETVTIYALEAAYPNPFNPSVTVPFAVPEPAQVRVSLYDVLGRQIAVLVDNRFETGRYRVRFDGSGLASGIYVLHVVMESDAGSTMRAFTQRLTLLK